MTLFVLLLIANGAPVVARMVLHDRFVRPVDGGLNFVDGRRLLGPRKTVLGLLSAALATMLVALILNVSWQSGLVVAAGAMAGDMLSSFIKRRVGVAPHGVA
jgi:CDP-diglyceride synthetase